MSSVEPHLDLSLLHVAGWRLPSLSIIPLHDQHCILHLHFFQFLCILSTHFNQQWTTKWLSTLNMITITINPTPNNIYHILNPPASATSYIRLSHTWAVHIPCIRIRIHRWSQQPIGDNVIDRQLSAFILSSMGQFDIDSYRYPLTWNINCCQWTAWLVSAHADRGLGARVRVLSHKLLGCICGNPLQSPIGYLFLILDLGRFKYLPVSSANCAIWGSCELRVTCGSSPCYVCSLAQRHYC